MSMNLEQALEVLNRHRHRGSDRWQVVQGLRTTSVKPFDDSPSPSWLSAFEVIAIAEKYEPAGGPNEERA